MPSHMPQPLELIPTELVPSADVLDAGRNTNPNGQYDRHKSDIFPTNLPIELQGELGMYMRGLSNEHPLYKAVSGLKLAHNLYFAESQSAGFKPTETINRGRRATALQQHIGQCIAGGYDNVMERTKSPEVAIGAIKRHIEEREDDCTNDYEFELDYRIRILAELDEPMPKYVVTTDYSHLNGIPVFPDLDRESQTDDAPISSESLRRIRVYHNVEQIKIVRHRIKRLRFEYMSALALTQILENAVSQPVKAD